MFFLVEKIIEKAIYLFAFVVFLGGFLGGPALFIYQVYFYLRFGEWSSFSLISVLSELDSRPGHWALNPESWVGLHYILDFIPLSLVLFFTGAFLGGYLFGLADDYAKSNDKLFNR